MKKIITTLVIVVLVALAGSAIALTFNGSQYENIGNIADNPAEFSVQATINIVHISDPGRHYAIVSKGNWSTSSGWSMYLSPICGPDKTLVCLRFQVQGDIGSANEFYLNANDITNTPLNDGQDHVVKGVWDGTTAKVFVDGVEVTHLEGVYPTGRSFSTSYDTFIGDVSDHGNNRTFIGSISDVSIIADGVTVYDSTVSATPTPTPVVTPTPTPVPTSATIHVETITLVGQDIDAELTTALNSINGDIISVVFIGPALNDWKVIYSQ